MLKQVLKVLIVPMVVLALASPAWANGLGVVFDPVPQPPGGGTGLYDVIPPGGPFSVTWQSCNTVLQSPPGVIPPSGPGSELSSANGYVACLGFANYTGGDISSLTLSFVASGALDGLTLSCSNADAYLATNNCSSYSSPLTDGETVTLTFTGPLNIPPVTDFFFGVCGTDSTGACNSDTGVTGMPDSTIWVPTYDPGTLVLLATGMAFLGLGGLRRTA